MQTSQEYGFLKPGTENKNAAKINSVLLAGLRNSQPLSVIKRMQSSSGTRAHKEPAGQEALTGKLKARQL